MKGLINMAAPITHVVLSEKVFDKYFSDKDLRKFIVGTSFPDIRYLGVIDRSKTHFSSPKLTEIQKEESFMAGMMFHSFVDEVREAYLHENNLYEYLPKSIFIGQALKLFEDKLSFKKTNNLDKYINFLNEILVEETRYGISSADLEKWHKLVQKTLAIDATPKDIIEFFDIIGRPKNMAIEINILIEKLENDDKVLNTLNDFYNNFEILCEKGL